MSKPKLYSHGRLTPWFGMPDGPEKDRMMAEEPLWFRRILFVALMGFLFGIARY